MIPPPKISIVTPCFNSERTIRETLLSVQSQRYSNLEHIVIDGGSTDGTLKILQEFPQIIWVSEKDEGLYDAMNKGIARATGEFIGILNSDDCFRPDALNKVASAIQKNPEWEALFGDVVYVDGDGREIFRREEAVFDYDVLRYWLNYVNHQTLFVRKSLYQRMGTYHHHDFVHCCDYEFLLRIGREKCPVGHVPAFLVNFRYHSRGQSSDLRVIANMGRERRQIQRQYGVPARWAKILSFYGRLTRQFQKLIYRGKCDLIPGNWLLKKHRHANNDFSSNASFDKKDAPKP